MTIPKKQECLSWPLGAECGNTAKGNLGGGGRGRRQQWVHDKRGGRGKMKAYGWMGRTIHLKTSGIMDIRAM